MTITSGLMSSNKQDWSTPQEFMDKLPVTFDLDVCAYDSTTKAPKWFTEADDAFTKQWEGRCWMNPPYGQALPKWLEKAYKESLCSYCDAIWCLIPARTDTKWFHNIACKGKIILLKGRVSFEQNGKPVGSPAFPSMLVIYDKKVNPAIVTWDWKND